MITTNIQDACNALRIGQVIGLPTETVYGLAADAYNIAAVERIFDLKKRPRFNPLILHIGAIEALHEVARNIPPLALQLADAFWPGPLTLVLPKQPRVPGIITANQQTVAVRMPAHRTALQLLHMLNFPLAAPSANPFGCISPTTAQHVDRYFGDELALVLNGGACRNGVESTIIGFRNEQPVLYRHGAIALEDLEQEVGPIDIATNDDHTPAAPGMLSRHYAPRTRTIHSVDIAKDIALNADKKVGLLVFSQVPSMAGHLVYEILSRDGILAESAANLYAAMHRLDQQGLDLIIAEQLPNKGLGRTMNDRLRRATQN